MISITGNYMSKYGGLMFVNKQEAMDMDIQSLSYDEMKIYQLRVVNFIAKNTTRKSEKEVLQNKLDELAELMSDIMLERVGFLFGDTNNNLL